MADEGDCYRVSDAAQETWAGHEGALAVFIGGEWHFFIPQEGMQVFDQDAGHMLLFRSCWEHVLPPEVPSGGTVSDAEARSALAALTRALVAMGWLADSEP